MISNHENGRRVGALKFCRRVLGLLGFLSVFFALTSTGESGEAWIRFLVPIGHGPAPGVPFTIANCSYAEGLTSATGWYCYTQGRDPLILHGKKEVNDFFRPVVSYEVATEDKTKWRKLRLDSEQVASDTVTVSPDNPLVKVSMDLGPLRSWVGTHRYGRVVLESGDAAIIALEDLLPTSRARDANGNFKEDVFGGDTRMRQQGYKPPRPDDPAVLSNVISLGGQLIVEFIFDAGAETVSLKGTRTLDGDFWPMVVFYVGNSEKDWKEIGKSQHQGTPTTLQITSRAAEVVRILVNDYRPLIGKHKFGKIVFSNGQSGVFYLDLLDPKN